MEPTLDNWTTIFLVTASQGVLLFFLFVFNRHWPQPKNKVLAGVVISFSLMLLYYVAFWVGILPFLPPQLYLLENLTYIIAPLIYIYVLLINNRPISTQTWVHFVPFFIVAISFLAGSFKFGAVIQCIHLSIYTLLSWVVLNKTSPQYKWSKEVTISFSLFSFGFLTYYILVWNRWLTPQYDYWISASMSFFIYAIGYKAIVTPDLLSEVQPRSTKYEKSLISETAATAISDKIIEHIEAGKVYKNGEYKLSDLADELAIPTHTLSQVLNTNLNKSFSGLMNSYRIKEAKRLLEREQTSSIISIAYMVGFNNKVSFNNSFKRHTGYTPTEYRNIYSEFQVSMN